jgi:hypothetical protein
LKSTAFETRVLGFKRREPEGRFSLHGIVELARGISSDSNAILAYDLGGDLGSRF